MRIQHNIMAMNAYRNYTNNTSMLSKNLEKLSSGYKINRAGDDAAGLAISEKMRAQITGLNKAQDNAKDGISLVQTAEGALTEVHDMLNRMYELASQSANGTYDGTDREQIQKEFTALADEIDRISKTANFNEIYFFTGGADAAATATPEAALDAANAAQLVAENTKFAFDAAATDEMKTAFNEALGTGVDITVAVDAGQGTTTDFDNGDTVTITGIPQGYTLRYMDANDADATVTDGTALTVGTATGNIKAGDLTFTVQDADGNTVGTLTLGMPATGDAADGTTTITLAPGAADAADGATAAAGDTSVTVTPPTTAAPTEDTAPAVGDTGEYTYDLTGMAIEGDGDVTVTLGGKEYTVAVTDGMTAQDFVGALKTAFDADPLSAGATAGDITFTDNNDGTFTLTAANNGTWDITMEDISIAPAEEDGGRTLGGIWLQIGADANEANQLTVNIPEMNATTLGVRNLDVTEQESALDALATIKDAINQVSSIRGDLGAVQNRLDHTINNLSVMEENIQDAESTIRDTDVAEEMMAYTKNNILVQSAQAMLAQANRVPQGVLQLLQ